MRGLLRTAYVRRITVQYLTVLLYDGNAGQDRDPVRGNKVLDFRRPLLGLDSLGFRHSLLPLSEDFRHSLL